MLKNKNNTTTLLYLYTRQDSNMALEKRQIFGQFWVALGGAVNKGKICSNSRVIGPFFRFELVEMYSARINSERYGSACAIKTFGIIGP